MHLTLTLAVFSVFLLAVPGFLGRRFNLLSQQGTKDLSNLLVNFTAPCLVFTSIFSKYTLPDLARDWMLPVIQFSIMVTGWVIGKILVSCLPMSSDDERRGFHYQCTINNCGYLPLALVGFAFNEKVEAALLFSLLGCETAIWTIGFCTISGKKFSLSNLKHLFNPPLVAIYSAIILRALTDHFGITELFLSGDKQSLLATIFSTARAIGKMTVIIAMFVAGSRIAAMHPHGFKRLNLWVLSAVRVLIIPLILMSIIVQIPMPLEARIVGLVVASMPASITSMILSEIYGGDHDLITGAVLITHLAALVTVPLLLGWFL
ncbi:AEC family transporter [Verrucomicrobiota bacterium]